MMCSLLETAFFYYFSTVAQCLAAIVALSAIFAHFKMNELKDFLIGDGKATFSRMGDNPDGSGAEPGYKLKNGNIKQWLRLRDGIGRKNIKEIEKVIKLLAEEEKSNGGTIETNPTGLQYLYNRFCKIENKRKKLIINISRSVKISFFTIALCVVSLLIIYYFNDQKTCLVIIAIIVLTLTSCSLSLVYQGIMESLDMGDEILM